MRRLIIALLTFLLVLSASYSAAESAADRNPEFVYDADGIELFGIGSTRKDAESAMSETPEFTASVLVEPNEEELKFYPKKNDSICRFALFGSVQKWIPWGMPPQTIVYGCGISVTYDSSDFSGIIQKYEDAEYASVDDEREAAAAMIAEVDGHFLRNMPVLKIEILKHGFESISGAYVGMPLEPSILGTYRDQCQYFVGGVELSEDYVRGLDDTMGIVRVTECANRDGGFVERIVIDVME